MAPARASVLPNLSMKTVNDFAALYPAFFKHRNLQSDSNL